MTGPAIDEHNLIHFAKRFKELVKEKAIKAVIAFEMSIKAHNVYMGT
jgi:hypothetical protein